MAIAMKNGLVCIVQCGMDLNVNKKRLCMGNSKVLQQLYQLGLTDFEQTIKLVARSNEQQLLINDEITLGAITDCTYFIYENYELRKIGKVGGGSRCLRRRLLDYRSTDPTGIKIAQSISKKNKVHILAIPFGATAEKMYGVLTEGSVKGPKLEKALIERAISMGIELQWNKNKG